MLSPSVQTREFDLTLTTSSATSGSSATVGVFRWGPVEEPVRITTNEAELVRVFGRPDNFTTQFFHSAANYLLYAVPLTIVRAIDDATSINAAATTPILVKNVNDYESKDLTGESFIGRYPGQLGNSIKVSAADDTNYSTWSYSDEFDYAPQTGEFNLVVVDEDGLISGTAGTVLERYELMSKTEGAKKPDGTSAYLNEVIKNQSNWIFVGDLNEIDFTQSSSLGIYEISLTGGVDTSTMASVDFSSAWAVLNNTDEVEFVNSFAGPVESTTKAESIDIAETREVNVAFIAPGLDDVYNNATTVDNLVTFYDTTVNKSSSYGFGVDNWKMVYDKYADKNIWIPCDSDAAGLHSRLFSQNEPWESPAGLNRGQLRNVIKLAWNSNKAERDTLYNSNINSIVSLRGEGIVLFGDKTLLKRPSAFSRINVRSLFIVVKSAISESARYQLFELNDALTRSIFRNSQDRYLERVQARRGVSRYLVKCDEDNNTPQVIDSNQFVASIYMAPTRSINNVVLNFIATGTGVDFEEIEGSFFS